MLLLAVLAALAIPALPLSVVNAYAVGYARAAVRGQAPLADWALGAVTRDPFGSVQWLATADPDLYARTRLRAGDLGQGLHLLNTSPDSVSPMLLWEVGNVLAEGGDTVEATRVLSAGHWIQVHLAHQGLRAEASGEALGALWAYGLSWRVNPRDVRHREAALFRYAQLAARHGDYDRAVEVCGALERAEVLQLWCARLVGQVYYQSGDYEAAREAFSRALVLDAEMPSNYLWLGRVLARLGLSKESTAEYRRGLELAPDDCSLSLEIARALVDSGSAEEACLYLATCLGWDDENYHDPVEEAWATAGCRDEYE
jgi:tetratricopeptide (TPR) repeat protein